MANRFHNSQTPPKKSPGKAGKPVNHRGVDNPPMPMKTANWPGLPGKGQPRGRGDGTKKVKQHPASEGI